MLKLGKVLCSAVLSIVVTGASAANLYVEGTNPAQMYEVVKPVVGDTVTPIFLFGDNPQELLAHLDPEAVRKAGVEQATFDYYASKVRPESLAYGVVGYAMGGNVVPGNESINKTCAIVMATHEQMRTTSTMFHEAVHCKNFSELRSDRDAWQLAVSMNRPALGMTNQQFLSPVPRSAGCLCTGRVFSKSGCGGWGWDGDASSKTRQKHCDIHRLSDGPARIKDVQHKGCLLDVCA